MGNNYKQAQYTRPTGFRLSPTIRTKLEKIAAWEGVDMAAVVRRLINQEYQAHRQEIEGNFKFSVKTKNNEKSQKNLIE